MSRRTRGSKFGRGKIGGAVSMAEDVKLSKAAYGGKPVEGYTIDPELSNVNYTTYVDPEGRATVAYRGTNTKNWRDIGTDVGLAFLGVQHANKLSRFQNARKVADSATSKYGKDKVSLTGHSLGASQTLAISNQTGLPARSFNPYVSLGDVAFNRRNYRNTQNYHQKGDIVSFLSPYMKKLTTTVRKKRSRDPHGLANFSS
jgi:hypothetical protein